MNAVVTLTFEEALAKAAEYAGRGENGVAIDLLQKLLAVQPNHPQALFGLGVVRCNNGDVNQGVHALLSATRITLERGMLGALMMQLDNMRAFSDLVAVSTEFRVVIDDDPVLLGRWGGAHVFLSNYAEALPLLERALAAGGGGPRYFAQPLHCPMSSWPL